MNPSLIAILATVLLDAIGVGIVMPILPGLLRSLAATGSTDTHYGVLLALYAFAQFLCAPLLGALSDRFGRRPVLLASLAGAALDYLLMALAPTLAWLYVGRLIAGITGANVAVATAYVTDVTAEPDRARRFGQLGAMMGIGFIAGPLIGGLLGALHLRAPFVAAALLNALNLVLVWRVLPESRPRSAGGGRTAGALNPFANLRRLSGAPALAPLVGIYVIVALVSQAPATLWILYGQEHFGWSTPVAGLSLAGYGACHALAQAFAIGPLIARLGERRALALGLAGDARTAGRRYASGRTAGHAGERGEPDRRRGATGRHRDLRGDARDVAGARLGCRRAAVPARATVAGRRAPGERAARIRVSVGARRRVQPASVTRFASRTSCQRPPALRKIVSVWPERRIVSPPGGVASISMKLRRYAQSPITRSSSIR